MLNDLDLIYTGGTGNSDPLLSLGGTKGDAIPQQSIAWSDAGFAGITLVECDGFTDNYQLTILDDSTIALRDVVTGFMGTWVQPTADGSFYLEAPINDLDTQQFAWLKITIVYVDFSAAVAAITTGLETHGLTITQSISALLPEITPAISESGGVFYRCAMMANNTSDDLIISASVDNKSSPVTIAVGLDPVAVGADPTATTSDGETPPTGVVFSEPSEVSPLSIEILIPTYMKPVWFRISVPSFNVSGAEPAFFKLNFNVIVA